MGWAKDSGGMRERETAPNGAGGQGPDPVSGPGPASGKIKGCAAHPAPITMGKLPKSSPHVD
jgi:hypothetical protein